MKHRPFWVLLGTDYAGKSAVLAQLAGDPTLSGISFDNGLVTDDDGFVACLRDRCLDSRAQPDRIDSPDFVLSLLQAGLVLLRDAMRRAPAANRVVVDSYYYKVLAKCSLAGIVNDALFAWWRSFPQPTGVIFLDVEPATAWRRARNGADVHRYERYGDDRTRRGFQRYQTALRRSLLQEVHDLPVHVVAPSDDLTATTSAVRRIVEATR